MADENDGSIAPAPLSLRKFLITEIVASVVINGVLGALIGWLVVRKMDSVPFLGDGGIAVDVVVSAFAIGVLLTLIVTPIMRGRLRQWASTGGGPEYSVAQLPGPMKRLPRNVILRALVMGLGGVILMAPFVLAAFWLAGADKVSPGGFVWFKGLYGGLFGAGFTPFALLPMLAGRIR